MTRKKTRQNASRNKSNDDDGGSFDVWTSSGACGFDFQVGETYLVYADEGSNLFFTSSCTRTNRLSDAGPDLSYFFLQE